MSQHAVKPGETKRPSAFDAFLALCLVGWVYESAWAVIAAWSSDRKVDALFQAALAVVGTFGIGWTLSAGSSGHGRT